MRLFISLWLFTFTPCIAQQNAVAITIDDVPNIRLCQADGLSSALLKQLQATNIPVTIFINEKNVYANNFLKENMQCLEQWLNTKNITAGNHSYSHINYADTTLEGFQRDILEGERLTSKILGRKPTYFRFPFNSLGNDSVAHASIQKFLKDHHYVLAPYTIESEDWVFSNLYEEALRNNDMAKATAIGEEYVLHTMNMFAHFEKMSKQIYGRNIPHIYLCHDNQLNTDYLRKLTTALSSKGYRFISLEEALQDKVYESPVYYWGRYGFSWIYRWVKDVEKRKTMMRTEPVNRMLTGQ